MVCDSHLFGGVFAFGGWLADVCLYAYLGPLYVAVMGAV